MHFRLTLALVTLLDILEANANSPIYDFPKWYLLQQLDEQDNINSDEVGEKDLTQVETIKNEVTNSEMFDNYDSGKNEPVANDFNNIFDIAERTDDNSKGLNQNERVFSSADKGRNNAEQEITKEVVPKYIYAGRQENKEFYPHLNKYSLKPDGVDSSTHLKDVFDKMQITEYKPEVIFKIRLFYVASNLNKKMEEQESNEKYNLYVKSFLSRGKENDRPVTTVGRSLYDTPVGRVVLSQLVDKGDILKLVKGQANKRNRGRPPIIEDFRDYSDFFESLGDNTAKPHNHNSHTFGKQQELIISKDKDPTVKKRIFSIFSKWKQFSPVNRNVKFRRPSYVYRNFLGVPSDDGAFVTAETRGSMRAPGSPLRWG